MPQETEAPEYPPPPTRRRRVNRYELVAEPLGIYPPAWAGTMLEFRSRLGELTIVRMKISPHSLHGGEGSYEGYLVGVELACEGMGFPLHATLDGSEKYPYMRVPWKGGLPTDADQVAWDETERWRKEAGRHALAEAKRRFDLYRPFMGLPAIQARSEPTRGAPLLADALSPGSSASWSVESAWEYLVANAMKTHQEVPEANKAYIWAKRPYLMKPPKGQRPPRAHSLPLQEAIVDREASAPRFTCSRCGQSWEQDPRIQTECPTCQVDPGTPCRRPSGHRAPEPHVPREQLALDRGLIEPCPAIAQADTPRPPLPPQAPDPLPAEVLSRSKEVRRRGRRALQLGFDLG